MRTYNADRIVPQTQIASKRKAVITSQTQLVNLETASVLLSSERGLTLAVKTIREYCRSGKWQQGIHWLKPGRSYLINMAAVYESLLR